MAIMYCRAEEVLVDNPVDQHGIVVNETHASFIGTSHARTRWPLRIYQKISISAGAAALAEARKRTKYSGFLHTYSFTPVPVETLCVWGAEAEDLLE